MVQAQPHQMDLIIGLVVDEVSEELNVSRDQIEPAPSLGTQVETHFILGMAKTKSAVKILLDIDKVLSAEEMDALSRTA